jgi:hypothetical protein
MVKPFRPIELPMLPQSKRRRNPSPKPDRAAYSLIVRGRDGLTRLERFDTAGAYKARLARLESSAVESVSIDEILQLLDP